MDGESGGSLARGTTAGIGVGLLFLGVAYLIVGFAWSQGSFVAAFLLLVLGIALAAVEIRQAAGTEGRKAALLAGALFWGACATLMMVGGMRYTSGSGLFGAQEFVVNCVLLPLVAFGIPALVVYALVPMVKPQRDRRVLWIIVVVLLLVCGCTEASDRASSRRQLVERVRKVAGKVGVDLPEQVKWRVTFHTGAPNGYADVSGTGYGLQAVGYGQGSRLRGIVFSARSPVRRVSSAREAVEALRACPAIHSSLVPGASDVRAVRARNGTDWTAALKTPKVLLSTDAVPSGEVTVSDDGSVTVVVRETMPVPYDD